MSQSQFPAITCDSLKAREKSRVQGAIGIASHWLKDWRELFKPVTSIVNAIAQLLFFFLQSIGNCSTMRDWLRNTYFQPIKGKVRDFWLYCFFPCLVSVTFIGRSSFGRRLMCTLAKTSIPDCTNTSSLRFQPPEGFADSSRICKISLGIT